MKKQNINLIYLNCVHENKLMKPLNLMIRFFTLLMLVKPLHKYEVTHICCMENGFVRNCLKRLYFLLIKFAEKVDQKRDFFK